MYDSSIILRRLAYPADETDEYGNLLKPEPVDVEVFAEVLSVGYKEYYEAAAKGFKPEIKFKLADAAEYTEAQQVIYNGANYNVIRTYKAPNSAELEITCEKGIA